MQLRPYPHSSRTLATLLVVACAVLYPTIAARAQSPSPTTTTSTGGAQSTPATDDERSTTTPATSAPAPATPTQPAAAPAASSGGRGRSLVRAYGILWAGAFVSQGVQSYGQLNTSAATSASNPILLRDPNQALLSFQVQQTRAGIVVGEGTPVQGTLEVDFIHFDQSSPTTQAFPRIRQALIEWKPNEHHRLFIGQTWDLFGNTNSSLLSHSYNLVGTLFQSGNIGFMRHQLGWSGRFGDLEVASALGLQGANTGPVYNDIERGHTPTASARVMYNLPDHHGVVGASGIYSALRLTHTTTGAYQYRQAGGAVVFGDLTFGGLNIHAEAYFAQNLANMGALDLAQGRFGTDVRDIGGYVSARYDHGEHAITAMAGAAAVLNPSGVVAGYTPASMGPPSVAASVNLNAGPGMTSNVSAHVGYWYTPVRGFSIVLEPYLYATHFKLAAVDAGRTSTNLSLGTSLGAIYKF